MSTRTTNISPVTAPAQRIALLAGGFLAIASFTASAQFGSESPIATAGGSVTGLASADFDGDGDLDVVVTREFGPVAVGWHSNLGGGAFGAVQAIGPQAISADTALALDFDHDGDIDFISELDFYTPELGPDYQVLLFTNAGDGTFTWQTLLYFGIYSGNSLALGDLEGDGDQDLFYVSYGDDKLSVLENRGVGFSWMPQLIADPVGGPDIRPADIDGDGDMDVVVTSSYLEQIYWYENLDGSEAFGPKQMIDGNVPGAGVLDAADLDADGDPDLLVSAAAGGTSDLRWYENLGAGAFGSSKLISTVGFPGADVLGVDIEGDGDIDVLSADFYGPSWYANDGEAHFGPRQVISSSSLVLSQIDAPDLSGDGVPDVLFGTTSGGGGKVAWHEGLSPAHWTDLGFALAGSVGLPSLAGSGTLATGSAGSLALTSAKPLAVAGLFLSLTSTPAPFKCGTLAPVPVASSVVLTTGATGSVVLPWASWPAGLSGASVYLQYAIHDTGAVCGFALSNALRADPP